MTKEKLLEMLNTGADSLMVTFIKKDGTERTMHCSRNFRLLEEFADKLGYVKPSGSKAPVELPGSLVRVWDIDNKGWRTVNAATVTDATFISHFFDDLDNEDIEDEDIAL